MKKGKYGDVGHFVKYMEHSLKLKDMARDTKTSRPVTKKKGDNLSNTMNNCGFRI